MLLLSKNTNSIGEHNKLKKNKKILINPIVLDLIYAL